MKGVDSMGGNKGCWFRFCNHQWNVWSSWLLCDRWLTLICDFETNKKKFTKEYIRAGKKFKLPRDGGKKSVLPKEIPSDRAHGV